MKDRAKPKDALLASIGARVRAFRLAARLPVREIAAKASLSPRFVNQLEAGEGNISITGLCRVASALGRALPEIIPPPMDDRSLHARVWHLLSECSNEDLRELEQWLERRKGSAHGPRFIALIGLRGSGKSTVGLALARRLKVEFVELDKLVEEAAAMKLSEIFTTHGESYYRRLEAEVLAKLFAASGGCVLAPGGSVVTDEKSWEMIKRQCFTVWLHATPEEFLRRMHRQGDTRPMQGRTRSSARTELKALLARREPLYAESQLMIKTSELKPAIVVNRIIEAVSDNGKKTLAARSSNGRGQHPAQHP